MAFAYPDFPEDWATILERYMLAFQNNEFLKASDISEELIDLSLEKYPDLVFSAYSRKGLALEEYFSYEFEILNKAAKYVLRPLGLNYDEIFLEPSGVMISQELRFYKNTEDILREREPFQTKLQKLETIILQARQAYTNAIVADSENAMFDLTLDLLRVDLTYGSFLMGVGQYDKSVYLLEELFLAYDTHMGENMLLDYLALNVSLQVGFYLKSKMDFEGAYRYAQRAETIIPILKENNPRVSFKSEYEKLSRLKDHRPFLGQN